MSTNNVQTGILLPPPALARYLLFSLRPDSDPKEVLQDLVDSDMGEDKVLD